MILPALEVQGMKKQRKALLSRLLVFLGMILIIGISFNQLSLMSFSQDVYAPGAPVLMEGGRESVEYVIVYGYVFRFNTTLGYDMPVVDVKVRLWATDELFEDVVWTDNDGRYESTVVFRVGQLVSVLVEGTRYVRFISYHAVDTCELDSVYL